MRERLSRQEIIDRERRMTDAESVRRARESVKLELEKRTALGLPIAVFDKKERKMYARYPDGTRIPMGQRGMPDGKDE